MNTAKTPYDIRQIINRVKYLDWEFAVLYSGDSMFLQIQFYAPDMITKKPTKQYCRKWILSPFMTESEIVSTCWKAVLAAVEHEARENFLYAPSDELKPRPIFQPHVDVARMYEFVSRRDSLDIKDGERTGEWTMGR